MIQKATFLKAVAALAAGLLLSSCKEEPKVIELSVSDKTVAFETAGGDKTVTVTCNDAWTAASSADWVDVSPKSGNGNGSIKITAGANETFDVRSADIVVTSGDKSQTIKVNQLSLSPSLVISPTSSEIGHAGGEIELTITSNAPWDIHCPIDGPVAIWATPDKESGEGSATVKITVQPNLEREVRSITLAVTEKIGNSHQDLTITQEMAPLSRRTDSLVLVGIYNLTDGANWKESRRWDLEKPMDKWPGVKLDKDGRVIELSLTNETVTTKDWELPASLTDLTELSIFQAVGSRVVGVFPEFLYDMTKLTKLVINGNKITGSFSDKVANWTEMTNLYINKNKEFGGTLPAAFGSLKKLVNLNIAQTAIGGTLPAELSGCESLQNFMAYETAFTAIPDNWDQWPSLKIVQLYGCKSLVCPLPASLGNAKNITSLQLKNGNFTGNIPESYANLPATCNQLFVNGNQLKGVVPAAVQAHANWTKWKAETNILPQQEGYGLTLE